MGLLLRADAYAAELPDRSGTYLLTYSGALALTGPTVHQLIERLTPYLDGTHTLAELTADLPAERRERVEELIETLLKRGVVRNVADPGQSADVRAEQFDAYHRELAFVGRCRSPTSPPRPRAGSSPASSSAWTSSSPATATRREWSH